MSEQVYTQGLGWQAEALAEVNDGVIVADANGKILHMNPSAERLTSWGLGEAKGKPITEVVKLFTADRVSLADRFELVLRDGKTLTLPPNSIIVTKNGDTFDVEDSMSPLLDAKRSVTGILVVLNDATRKKLAAAQLRRFSQAVEQSPSLVVVTDVDANIEYVNPKFTEVTGYSEAEVIGKNPRLLKSGAMLADEYSKMWGVLVSGSEWRGYFHNKRKNGVGYWAYAAISPISDSAGKITHYVCVQEDVTKQRLAEEALRASEERMRAMFQAMTDVVIVIDRDGRYLEIAPTNPELLYRVDGGILGKTLHDVFPKDRADSFLTIVQKCVDSNSVVETEYRLPIGDKDVWFEARLSPMPGGKAVLVAHDVTAKRLAAQALQESKLSLDRANKILLTTSRLSKELLSQEMPDVGGLLRTIGENVSAEKVFLCRKSYDDEVAEAPMFKSGWCRFMSPNIVLDCPCELDKPTADGVLRWVSENTPFYGIESVFPPEMRSAAAHLHLPVGEAILLVPIVLNQDAWGVVGFAFGGLIANLSVAEQDAIVSLSRVLAVVVNNEVRTRFLQKHITDSFGIFDKVLYAEVVEDGARQ